MEYTLYFFLILGILIGFYLLDLLADILNLKALDPELPQEFKDVYDQEKYAQSQNYTRETTRFGMIETTFSLLLFLTFWFLGGFAWLNTWVTSWGYPSIITGLFFVSLLFLGNFILAFPFQLYGTFVLEEKFGFNQTTPATFLLDQVKGLLLTALIGLPLLAILLYFYEEFSLAWLYSWVILTAFSLIMAYLAPKIILPLFNKFTPLESGELKTRIQALAEECQFPIKEISIMDGSKRSSKSNAFFSGFGKNKVIALYDTLIKNHSIEELVAILAHEIGHYKKKHILQALTLSILQTGLLLFLLNLFLKTPALYAAFGIHYQESPPIYCGFIFFALLFKPINKIISLLGALISRKNEYEADAYASAITRTPHALIAALKKLSADNLGNLTPHPFYVFLYHSHPTTLQRIHALRSQA